MMERLLLAHGDLDGLDGEGHGAAHGDTGHQAGVVVDEEAAGAVAGHEQAGDGLTVLVNGLGFLVDKDALLGGQQAGAQPEAIEGSLLDLGQVIGQLEYAGQDGAS